MDGRETQKRSLRLATAVLSTTAGQIPDSVYLRSVHLQLKFLRQGQLSPKITNRESKNEYNI